MAKRFSRESAWFPEEPRSFIRVALQRLDEARFLFDGERYAATIYLAGYSVECGLKALILATGSKARWQATAESFRGSGWHEINRLREVYVERGGPRPPPAITRALTYVHDVWFVGLRYIPGDRTFREARQFLDSTDLILGRIEGRL